MICPICQKEFTPRAVNQIFCSRQCERTNSKQKYINRDEPPAPPDARPVAEFVCKNCGKTVFIYSRTDQRSSFCCGKCAVKYNNKRSKERNIKKRGDNIGMGSAMSLGNLICFERRSLD